MFTSARFSGSLRRFVVVLLLATGLSVGLASSAQAASRNGVCDVGEFCYYFNSNNDGSVSDHPASVADYGARQPSCYEFKSAGAGRGLCVKNNAASVYNRTSSTVRVYFKTNYGGISQSIPPGAKANLIALKNENASHGAAVGNYASRNDYPYRTSSAKVDKWNFYVRQCTSFAAWTVNSRLGIPFHNHYKGAHFGNAKTWDDAARTAGIPVYRSPRAGDIAVREGGRFGHVAFVTRVNSNGTFEVDEYNYRGREAYGHRTVSVGTANSQFSEFIRFK